MHVRSCKWHVASGPKNWDNRSGLGLRTGSGRKSHPRARPPPGRFGSPPELAMRLPMPVVIHTQSHAFSSRWREPQSDKASHRAPSSRRHRQHARHWDRESRLRSGPEMARSIRPKPSAFCPRDQGSWLTQRHMWPPSGGPALPMSHGRLPANPGPTFHTVPQEAQIHRNAAETTAQPPPKVQ